MREGTDFSFFMYSCNVHDSFVKVIGEQLVMLLKTKNEKKVGINMQWKEVMMLGLKFRL